MSVCGQLGHFGGHFSPSNLSCKEHCVLLQTLIDPWAEENVLDMELAEQLGCELEQLDKPILAMALNGKVFTQVFHKTSPITLVMSSNHYEKISLHIISALQQYAGSWLSPVSQPPY